MKKVILDIAGMRCGACAVGIELALAKKGGVISAKVSLNEKMALVNSIKNPTTGAINWHHQLYRCSSEHIHTDH